MFAVSRGSTGRVFASLVLAGIIAAPIGTLALLIAGRRPARTSGTWPRFRRFGTAVIGTVLLGGLVVGILRLLGVTERNAIVGGAALAAMGLAWLPVTRRWNARGHLCWSATIFLFVVYLAFVLDWTFASDLGPAGTAGGVLLWLFELFAAILACAYLWEICDALVRAVALLRRGTGASWRDALGAFMIWQSTSLVVARASVLGLFARKAAFLVTPKTSEQAKWWEALRANWGESVLALLGVLGIASALTRPTELAGPLLAGLLVFPTLGLAAAPVNSWALSARRCHLTCGSGGPASGGGRADARARPPFGAAARPPAAGRRAARAGPQSQPVAAAEFVGQFRQRQPLALDWQSVTESVDQQPVAVGQPDLDTRPLDLDTGQSGLDVPVTLAAARLVPAN